MSEETKQYTLRHKSDTSEYNIYLTPAQWEIMGEIWEDLGMQYIGVAVAVDFCPDCIMPTADCACREMNK